MENNNETYMLFNKKQVAEILNVSTKRYQDLLPKESFHLFKLDAITGSKSLMFLSDATIDYKDGLMDTGFIIEIPSAKNSCGCGDSFSA